MVFHTEEKWDLACRFGLLETGPGLAEVLPLGIIFNSLKKRLL
jgi:hypothetical protein